MRNRHYKIDSKPKENFISNEIVYTKANHVINETIYLIKNSRNVELQTILRSDSFRLFEKKSFKLEFMNKRPSILKKILSYWDIFLLVAFFVCFSLYLIVFTRIYLSNDRNIQYNFYSKINSAYKWVVAQWLYYNEFTDFTKEECALRLPDFFNSVTRPIDNCDSMCPPNLRKIERISNISKEDFLAKYAYTGVPVIITDAIAEWSALKTFNFKFLKDLYMNIDSLKLKPTSILNDLNELTLFKKFNQMSKNRKKHFNSKDEKLTCQFFPYKTKFDSLYDLFETIDEINYKDQFGNWRKDKPWYVGWSNCNNLVSQILRKHYQRPYFLPNDSEMSKLDWIFMGTPGYGAAIHIDDVQHQSWQAQISGIKHWTFKPPAECLHKCPFSLTADVLPGDIIIFDSNRWFHSTEIIGQDLSLTIGSEYD
jgi:histone arginine demethylase JMJD6